MSLIISLIVGTIAVYVTSYVLPGVQVDGWITALIVSVILGIVNTFIKPIIQIIALPITVLTLGLFSIIINGVLILLVAALVPGFTIQNFLWALAFGLVLWLVNAVLDSVTGN
jgi:putative membrane protein